MTFALVLASPVPMSYQGHVTLATFACVVVWWITQPIPWAIAAMLPFVVFPAANVMDIAATLRLLRPAHFLLDHGHRADGLCD
jgi:di/tricarboxylate transporter